MPTVETGSSGLRVFTDYPGANGSVRAVDSDRLALSPELRDSARRAMYWNVGVESATDRELTVTFDEPVVGPRGPAVRTGREPWRWLGADARVDETTFRYRFDAGERARFALAPPYQHEDFAVFLDGVDAPVTRETLVTSEGGRAVPLVRHGDPSPSHVVVTGRHHACESPGSYALEGFLEAVFDGDFAADHAVHAVPFVDLDGVERGDQGKHRAPHDHNRDYVDENAVSADLDPLYRSTAAVMDYVRGLRTRGDLVLALDFHAPYAWGEDNDRPFFVADPDDHPDALETVADRLAAHTRGDVLTFDPTPGVGVHGFYGQSGLTHTFTRFADRCGTNLSVSFEVPFVGTDPDPSTPASARSIGRGLARATGEWCQQR
jgi:hypothetical protein